LIAVFGLVARQEGAGIMERSSGISHFEKELRRVIEELRLQEDYDPTFSNPEIIKFLNEFRYHWTAEWRPFAIVAQLVEPRPTLEEACRELDALLIKIPTEPERRFIPRFINRLRKFKAQRRFKAEPKRAWRSTSKSDAPSEKTEFEK